MIFPVVINDSVRDYEDKVWKMILCMREMCTLICAPSLSFGQVALLQTTIEEYIELRLLLEFLLHYPDQIENFGPLKHLWTLRCESMHSRLKRVAKNTQHYKDVSQTMAEKHQRQQAAMVDLYDSHATVSSPVNFSTVRFEDDIQSAITNLCKSNGVRIQYICTQGTVDF